MTPADLEVASAVALIREPGGEAGLTRSGRIYVRAPHGVDVSACLKVLEAHRPEAVAFFEAEQQAVQPVTAHAQAVLPVATEHQPGAPAPEAAASAPPPDDGEGVPHVAHGEHAAEPTDDDVWQGRAYLRRDESGELRRHWIDERRMRDVLRLMGQRRQPFALPGDNTRW